ncbi:hypothetical protein MSAN_02427400 [Mycena sanguinolenta]|uniref:Uncharacterized protein n=1 Tax=Mycena sanguinolenta TaxID=230812 RepID=A0A8H7CF73_9AGAR|nr:hypothetical protein MSAN_02427400 [Mycena sanguinolenta]
MGSSRSRADVVSHGRRCSAPPSSLVLQPVPYPVLVVSAVCVEAAGTQSINESRSPPHQDGGVEPLRRRHSERCSPFEAPGHHDVHRDIIPNSGFTDRVVVPT